MVTGAKLQLDLLGNGLQKLLGTKASFPCLRGAMVWFISASLCFSLHPSFNQLPLFVRAQCGHQPSNIHNESVQILTMRLTMVSVFLD